MSASALLTVSTTPASTAGPRHCLAGGPSKVGHDRRSPGMDPGGQPQQPVRYYLWPGRAARAPEGEHAVSGRSRKGAQYPHCRRLNARRMRPDRSWRPHAIPRRHAHPRHRGNPRHARYRAVQQRLDDADKAGIVRPEHRTETPVGLVTASSSAPPRGHEVPRRPFGQRLGFHTVALPGWFGPGVRGEWPAGWRVVVAVGRKRRGRHHALDAGIGAAHSASTVPPRPR